MELIRIRHPRWLELRKSLVLQEPSILGWRRQILNLIKKNGWSTTPPGTARSVYHHKRLNRIGKLSLPD